MQQQDLTKEVECPGCGAVVKEWTTTMCYSRRRAKLKTCLKNFCEHCIRYSPARHRSECKDCYEAIEFTGTSIA